MKPKAFWFYTFLASCVTLVIAGIASAVIRFSDVEKTAEYRAYLAQARAYDAWYAERKLDPRQARFDEVLAGRMPAERVDDPGLRKLAADLRMLALGEADTSSRARTISAMFLDDGGGLGIRAWISCKEDDGAWKVDTCRMKPTVSSIGNPERLATLLGTDETAKRAALPEVPPEFRERPVWNGGTKEHRLLQERLQGTPRLWLGLGLWIAGSCVFAAAFFLFGHAKHRNERGWNSRGDSPYPDPFKTVPHFILGWVVYLAMLPGVLLMQAFRVVASDAQPALGRFKDKVVGRTFATEHERILAQLENLETRAAGRPNSEGTLGLIKDAVKKVRETQNLEELDKLRKVAEDIRLNYEVQEELRVTLT